MKRTKQIILACFAASTACFITSLFFWFAYVPPSAAWRLDLSKGVVSLWMIDRGMNRPPPDANVNQQRAQLSSGGIAHYGNLAHSYVVAKPGLDAGVAWFRFDAVRLWTPVCRQYGNHPCWYTRVPLILPVALFALASAYWLLPMHRRRDRLEQGHCPHCNYNLTANRSGKCPECGTPIPKSEPAAQAPARDPNPT